MGAAEENIRLLFRDAELEDKEKKEKSGLHVIIFDEIDAICRPRGTVTGSTGVHDTIVNQLLSKIDGVHSLNNILVIGMTNRKDMLDPALLRPGRLEVHVEIGLPDQHGRQQIFHIHTETMRKSQKLDSNVNLTVLAERTKNYSGAEIEGLVKSASSFALYSCIDVDKDQAHVDEKKSDVDMLVNMSHFERALREVPPAFGVADQDLKQLTRRGLVAFSDECKRLQTIGDTVIQQIQTSTDTSLLTVLLEGEAGSGKTAVAASWAIKAGCPYTKIISPDHYVGWSEASKCADITKRFDDAYKSPLSCILLDDLERLIEYVKIGPRFSNAVLQTLLVLLKRTPSHDNRRLLVVATTSCPRLMRDLEMYDTLFNIVAPVPQVDSFTQFHTITRELKMMTEEKEVLLPAAFFPISIKPLLSLLEMTKAVGVTVGAESAAGSAKASFAERLMRCIRDSGRLKIPTKPDATAAAI